MNSCIEWSCICKKWSFFVGIPLVAPSFWYASTLLSASLPLVYNLLHDWRQHLLVSGMCDNYLPIHDSSTFTLKELRMSSVGEPRWKQMS